MIQDLDSLKKFNVTEKFKLHYRLKICNVNIQFVYVKETSLFLWHQFFNSLMVNNNNSQSTKYGVAAHVYWN